MDKQYEQYCLADPLFYDAPVRAAGASEFAIAGRELPAGWQRLSMSEWLMCQADVPMPAQGWKIHVSACLANAEDVLASVWDYCVPRRISFKFLRGRLVLHMRNAKYAPRGGSGKLVTVYPLDEAHCERVCTELGAILTGQPGPYILSDLRIGEGPLYVRYGGFAERYCEDEAGELVPAIEDAAGALVPDRRGPVFTVPPWVPVPGFLEAHLAARGSATVDGLPYRIEQALHFSNGGGVYAGSERRTGEPVVLKEARPHAGLSGDGADAVTRLGRERDILTRLAGLDVVPGVRDYFELDGHYFLVQDRIEGRVLNSFFAERHPYLDPEPDPDRIREYTDWALRMHAGVASALAAVHERGVVFNDLHLFNVMVRPDETVALIDFEAAAHVEEERRPSIGNAGFIAPRDRAGFDIDRYSLACMRLALFAPLTTLIALDRTKAGHLAEVIAGLFPVGRRLLDEAVHEICGRPAATATTRPGPPELVPDGPGWEQARDAITRAILASATPDRDDRLFPGDPKQFTPGGGLGLAHGAAGVLYALLETGAGRFPEHEEWLVEHARRPVSGTPLGLYDGLLGVALVLERLGRRDSALEVAGTVLREPWERLGLDLSGGLAGAALALAHLGDVTGESELAGAAARAAGIVAQRCERGDAAGDGSRFARPGLLSGGAGRALLFVRLHERTGDGGWLDRAAVELAGDLDRCVFDRKGALHVDEGWRILPYLDGGGVGVGWACDDYLAHRHDERFAEAAAGARRAAQSPYYAEPGLLGGRAGMILYLSRDHAPGTAGGDRHVSAHVRRLAWHGLGYAGGLAFPGERLYRLSMDLGSGGAGVLLALGAALSGAPAGLPFLGPVATRTPKAFTGIPNP